MNSARHLPSFFVITPSFNQGAYIQQTIDSVLEQDYPHQAYWVVDGGSRDNTVHALKSYKNKLKWLSEPDKGQTNAINKGIQLLAKQKPSKRAIFSYLNSDDYYLPGTFKEVATAFHHHPEAQWLVGDCMIVNQDGREIQSWVRRYKSWWRKLSIAAGLAITNPIPQPAVFIRWEAVQKAGLFNESLRYVMDYEYWWRLKKLFGNPLIIDTPLAAFRIHQLSKGGAQYQQQFAEEYQVLSTYISHPLLQWLHQLHTHLIIGIYNRIK